MSHGCLVRQRVEFRKGGTGSPQDLCRPFGVTLLLVILVSLFLVGCGKKDAKDAYPKGDVAGAAAVDVAGISRKSAAFVAVAPLPRPTGPLTANATCVTPACHAKFATAPHIHGPVAQQACDSCHEADAGGHRYPLKREADKTCTFCHSVAGTQEHQHAALKQGCLSCHRPHESNAKFLLKTDTVERLCATCHDVPLKRFAHEPFAQGQCTVCHQPHQSEFNKLLRGGQGSQHCFMCHTDIQKAMASSTHVHKPAATDCVTCHSPHSADHERELKLPVTETCLTCHKNIGATMKNATVAHAAMTREHQCANCHTAHASNNAALLKARTDKVCLQCHDKAMKAADGRIIADLKPALLEAKYLHGPVRAGECSACHDVHGSTHADLLRKPFPTSFYAPFALENYALCFSCHEKQLVLQQETASLTNFRDGSRNLHFVHVNREEKGRTCKTCHAVHGSDLPRHMAETVPFEGSNWAMPIKYEATADGGRCSPGCHQSFAYGRTTSMHPTTRPTGGAGVVGGDNP